MSGGIQLHTFRKNAPFLPPLDTVIGRLVEVGLIEHWLKDLFPTSTKTKATEQRDEEAADEATGNMVRDSLMRV